jgi:MFS family permease
MLGQGNALLFIIVGVILVTVQLRYIGPWSQKYGERKLVFFALGLLTVGLLLTATTPEIPHPFYVQQIVENELLADNDVDSTEAIIGKISITLPDENHRGILGVLWLIIAVIPISIGAGLIRPSLNSLMTKRINSARYGSVLGISAAFVSAANAIAPLLGGLIFQNYGSTTPFFLWGIAMGLLLLLSLATIKPEHRVVIAS